MPTDLFESHRSSLHARLLDREQRLQSRSDRYWNELDQQHYRFDSRTRLAQALETITIEDFRAFYQRTLRDRGRRQLLVRSLGTSQAMTTPALPHPGQTERIIPDPDDFAAGKRFFPVTNGERPDYTAADPGTKPSKTSR
jgi:secreted Zn-dependent insulinase-like peptidase